MAREFLAPLGLVLALIAVNLIVKECFPFSHFPMYANPRISGVEYYFLTTSDGVPVPVCYLTGNTAASLKKMMATALKEKGLTLAGGSRSQAEGEVALTLLRRLREDARHSPNLPRWPSGIQLWRGRIDWNGDEFCESFEPLAKTLEPGPDTGVEFAPDTYSGKFLGTVEREQGFAIFQFLTMGGLAVLLWGWSRLPGHSQEWLAAGIGPGQTGRLEAFFLRLGLALAFWRAISTSLTFSAIPHPKGLALIEGVRPLLLWLGQPEHESWIWGGSLVLLIWYVTGRALVLPLTLLTGIHILRCTLRASQGTDHHGHQLITLVFFAQTLVAWMRWMSRSNPSKEGHRPGNETRNWLAMALVIAAVYGTCGIVKLIESRGRWLLRSHHFATQIVKTHRQRYYSDLEPRFGGNPDGASGSVRKGPDRYRLRIPAVSDWMMRHPALTRVLLAPGLLLELLAVFLFLGRGIAGLFGLAFVAFHLLVYRVMALDFSLNVETVWVVLINIPGWMIRVKFGNSSGPSGPEHPDRVPTGEART